MATLGALPAFAHGGLLRFGVATVLRWARAVAGMALRALSRLRDGAGPGWASQRRRQRAEAPTASGTGSEPLPTRVPLARKRVRESTRTRSGSRPSGT